MTTTIIKKKYLKYLLYIYIYVYNILLLKEIIIKSNKKNVLKKLLNI